MPRNRYCGPYGTVRFVIVGNANHHQPRGRACHVSGHREGVNAALVEVDWK
jgi:hypothetical protein